VLNHDEDSKKSFYFLYKRKVFRLEAKNSTECDMWVKSLELVMSKSEEYLDLDRYVDEKIFTKVSGKSLFKDYETILQEHRKKLWEEHQAKLKIEEEKRIEEERKRLEEEGKKKAHKVAKKKDSPLDVDMKKVQSEKSPPIQQKIEAKVGNRQDTLPNETKFRTGPVQPVRREEDDAQKVLKKVVDPVSSTKPVPKEIPITLGISTIERPFDKNDDEPDDSPKSRDDDAPLLIGNASSDAEEDYGTGINDAKDKNRSKLDEVPKQRTETTPEIEALIRLDDQRKESMYDIMMKKEESVKSSTGSLSGRNKTDDKNDPDAGYDGDRSRLNSRSTVNKTSLQSNRNPSTFSTIQPRTYIGEPVTQTSCLGSCWNMVLSIFSRR
jgi:hypothetical protein